MLGADFSLDTQLDFDISDFRSNHFFPYWTKVQYTNMIDPCMVVSNLCS
jgi:hypothetical protein